LSACFAQYNKLREHQSLDYHYTPEVYIEDHYCPVKVTNDHANSLF
jgi:hypothetical protein